METEPYQDPERVYFLSQWNMLEWALDKLGGADRPRAPTDLGSPILEAAAGRAVSTRLAASAPAQEAHTPSLCTGKEAA